MSARGRLLTCGAVAAALIATAPDPQDAERALAAGDLGTCLAAACGALAALVALALGVGALLVLAAALPGRVGLVADGVARHCLPRALRAALVAALGIGAAALPVTAAGADSPRPSTTRLIPDLDRAAAGRPALIALPTPSASPRSAAPVLVTPVLVTPGDTLWRIAAHALGPRATDRAVAAAWPRWWAVNRAVIGDDPDLIRPGQQLTPPTHLGEDRP